MIIGLYNMATNINIGFMDLYSDFVRLNQELMEDILHCSRFSAKII